MTSVLKRMHYLAVSGAGLLFGFAVPVAWSLDVQSLGRDWTEAYRTEQLAIFTKDVERGRR